MKPRIEHHKSGAVSFVGKEAVNVYACLAIAGGLRFYAKTGMRINRDYTPKNMLAFVERTTGRKFKRSQLVEAADFLTAFAQNARRGMDVEVK